MPHLKNIDTRADVNTFLQNIQTALVNSPAVNYNPHCVTIAYTDHLAVKDNLVVQSIIRGGTSRMVNVSIVVNKTKKEFALWHNIDASDWFISCAYKPADGSPDIKIGKDRCTPRAKVDDAAFFNSVDVDVRGLPPKAGKIEMEVHVVSRMRGGLSLGKSNIVAIGTRANWKGNSTDLQNTIAIHEVGHQLGMACDGAGIKPDKIPTHYNSRQGHVGSHCHFGIPAGQARYDAKADHQKSRCVMYGAAGSQSTFCKHCSKALKKADLKSGV